MDNVFELQESLYYIEHKWNRAVYTLEKNGHFDMTVESVPYYSQRDNATKDPPVKASTMCQITSLAMVLKSKGIEQQNPNMQFEDELYKIAKENGYGGDALWKKTSEVYDAVVEKVSLNYTVKAIYKYDIDTVKQQIEKGNPVIMSIDFKSNGQINGHILVVVGYTQNGFIVHDPYGNLNKGENDNYGLDTDGAYVEYSYNKWSICDKWISFLLSKECEK